MNPTRKRFYGEPGVPESLIRIARLQLDLMKREMQLTGLNQLQRSVNLGSATITVSSIWGQDDIQIDVPFGWEEEREIRRLENIPLWATYRPYPYPYEMHDAQTGADLMPYNRPCFPLYPDPGPSATHPYDHGFGVLKSFIILTGNEPAAARTPDSDISGALNIMPLSKVSLIGVFLSQRVWVTESMGSDDVWWSECIVGPGVQLTADPYARFIPAKRTAIYVAFLPQDQDEVVTFSLEPEDGRGGANSIGNVFIEPVTDTGTGERAVRVHLVMLDCLDGTPHDRIRVVVLDHQGNVLRNLSQAYQAEERFWSHRIPIIGSVVIDPETSTIKLGGFKQYPQAYLWDASKFPLIWGDYSIEVTPHAGTVFDYDIMSGENVSTALTTGTFSREIFSGTERLAFPQPDYPPDFSSCRLILSDQYGPWYEPYLGPEDEGTIEEFCDAAGGAFTGGGMFEGVSSSYPDQVLIRARYENRGHVIEGELEYSGNLSGHLLAGAVFQAGITTVYSPTYKGTIPKHTGWLGSPAAVYVAMEYPWSVSRCENVPQLIIPWAMSWYDWVDDNWRHCDIVLATTWDNIAQSIVPDPGGCEYGENCILCRMTYDQTTRVMVITDEDELVLHEVLTTGVSVGPKYYESVTDDRQISWIFPNGIAPTNTLGEAFGVPAGPSPYPNPFTYGKERNLRWPENPVHHYRSIGAGFAKDFYERVGGIPSEALVVTYGQTYRKDNYGDSEEQPRFHAKFNDADVPRMPAIDKVWFTHGSVFGKSKAIMTSE